MDPGKFWAVLAPMATAFQPALVMLTDCDELGKTPSDQFPVFSSQAPLLPLIQALMSAQKADCVQRNIYKIKPRDVFIKTPLTLQLPAKRSIIPLRSETRGKPVVQTSLIHTCRQVATRIVTYCFFCHCLLSPSNFLRKSSIYRFSNGRSASLSVIMGE